MTMLIEIITEAQRLALHRARCCVRGSSVKKVLGDTGCGLLG